MALSFIKWVTILFIINLPVRQAGYSLLINPHPNFVSVTEIEHNAAEKTLEVSVKIFTDDFEKTLRQNNSGTNVDLYKTENKAANDKLIQEYVKKNLAIKADGKALSLTYLGYEIKEEAVLSYYEVSNVSSAKKIDVTDKLLYDYKKEQFSVIHVKVNGTRKSTRLNNPNSEFSVSF